MIEFSIANRTRVALLLLACLFFLSGCSAGDTGPKCYPVRGTVTFNKQSVPEGMVIFHPLDAAATHFPNPVGYTDQDGNFELTTFSPSDGAPVGKYAITVEFRELKPDGDEMIHDGPNLLPEKYANPKTSGLEF